MCRNFANQASDRLGYRNLFSPVGAIPQSQNAFPFRNQDSGSRHSTWGAQELVQTSSDFRSWTMDLRRLSILCHLFGFRPSDFFRPSAPSTFGLPRSSAPIRSYPQLSAPKKSSTSPARNSVNSIFINKSPLQLIRLPRTIQLKSHRNDLRNTIGCPDCHAEPPQALRLTSFGTDQRISTSFKGTQSRKTMASPTIPASCYLFSLNRNLKRTVIVISPFGSSANRSLCYCASSHQIAPIRTKSHPFAPNRSDF